MATLPIDVGHRIEAGQIFADLASFSNRIREILLDLSLADLYRIQGEAVLMDRTLKEIEDLVRLRREAEAAQKAEELKELSKLANQNPRLRDGVPRPLAYAPANTEKERKRKERRLAKERSVANLHLPAPGPRRAFDFAS